MPVNAENNWWGKTDGPSETDLYGDVSIVPFSTDPELTCISALVAPNSPFPADGAVRMSPQGVTLSWEGSSQAVHDVHMGKTLENIQPVAIGIKEKSYTAGALEAGESYFWKIISREAFGNGNSAESPVWRFTTTGGVPDLEVATITAVPAGNVPVGEKITFTAIITNSEGGPVVDPFKMTYSMNGAEKVAFPIHAVIPKGDSVPVSWEWTMQEGAWSIELTADSEGTVEETNEANNSLLMNLSDVVDNTPPMVSVTSPISGSLNQEVAKIEITLADNLSAIDKTAVSASIQVNNASGVPVSGSVVEAGDKYTFTPETGTLPDETYTVSLTAADIHANSMDYYFTFTVDSTPPASPVITGGSVDSGLIRVRPMENSSGRMLITLTGTREDATSVWINGSEKVQAGSGEWSVGLTLAQGMNALEILAKDRTLNPSQSVWVDVAVDAEQTINFKYNAAGRIKSVVRGNAQ